jgi:hypothetical protein
MVGKGSSSGVANTCRVAAAILMHVKLLLHVVVGCVVCSKVVRGVLISQVVGVTEVGIVPVETLVANVALSLACMRVVVRYQLGVGVIAGDVCHILEQRTSRGVVVVVEGRQL